MKKWIKLSETENNYRATSLINGEVIEFNEYDMLRADYLGDDVIRICGELYLYSSSEKLV